MRASSLPRCFVATPSLFLCVLLPTVLWESLSLYIDVDSRADTLMGVSRKGDGATTWMALELVDTRGQCHALWVTGPLSAPQGGCG